MDLAAVWRFEKVQLMIYPDVPIDKMAKTFSKAHTDAKLLFAAVV